MNSQENQDQRKWVVRLLDWESRITEGAWWGIYIFAVLGLLHIAIARMFERMFFGPGGVYTIAGILIVVGVLVKLGKIRIQIKELALYQVGFIFIWLAYVPIWFYVGDERPWHQRGIIESIVVYFIMMSAFSAPGVTLVLWDRFKLKWWISLPLALILGWMGLVIFFMSSMFVTNSWL